MRSSLRFQTPSFQAVSFQAVSFQAVSFQAARRLSLATAAVMAMCAPALAAPNLITNGDFTNYTVAGLPSVQSYIVAGGASSGTSGATLTGWTNTGYSFVYQPNTASSTGAVVNATTNLYLWGPDGTIASPNYSNNGFKVSPTGGAFLAEDGAYQQGTLSQTLYNLTVGQSYTLSFNWAGAQQSGYTGATTDAWNVTWSDAANNVIKSVTTASLNNVSQGFTGWVAQTYQFVATTTTMTLGFMATGTPGGTPPFSLLDSVVLTATVPEPATWAVVLGGMAGLTALRVGRRRKLRA